MFAGIVGVGAWSIKFCKASGKRTLLPTINEMVYPLLACLFFPWGLSLLLLGLSYFLVWVSAKITTSIVSSSLSSAVSSMLKQRKNGFISQENIDN
jgi:hypothetical protein